MTDWMRKVLESKRAARQRLQQLPFSEKVKLLEKLRERTLLIARCRRHSGEALPSRKGCGLRPTSK
jgi:hypothetical protein